MAQTYEDLIDQLTDAVVYAAAQDDLWTGLATCLGNLKSGMINTGVYTNDEAQQVIIGLSGQDAGAIADIIIPSS